MISKEKKFEMSQRVFIGALSVLALIGLVYAQSQKGFISIDCGSQENANYIDETTGLNYTSDANLTDSGMSESIAPRFINATLPKQLLNVRRFPDGNKNCYTLNPAKGNSTKYLIRASFMSGDHDGQGGIPMQFDLLLDADVWDTINITEDSTVITKEIIHVPQRNYIHVCLLDTGNGKPFISSLELRPLDSSMYITVSGSLEQYVRWDIGSTTNKSFRFPDDIYDRIWTPHNNKSWMSISTQLDFNLNDDDSDRPPDSVMKTGAVPTNNRSLEISWTSEDHASGYYAYIYLAELQQLQSSQTRVFNLVINGQLDFSDISAHYLFTAIIGDRSPVYSKEMSYSFERAENSTLPPLLNAIEIYVVKEFSTLLTDQLDIDAITNIKSQYRVKKHWQGDPCTPKAYLWEGITCSYNNQYSPRIISLDLSASGLTGEIPTYIANLTVLQTLDLSNNDLNGRVPSFLAKLPFLRNLKLKGNNLIGPLPAELTERVKSGLLLLSADGNICQLSSCEKEQNNFVVIVVATVVPLSALFIAIAIICILKRRKHKARKRGSSSTDTESELGVLEPNSRQFTYSDVLRMTNNFEQEIGDGGFGKVYHGYLGNKEVAVKMLSPSSFQGYKQFKAEVKLLVRVHHTNLTALVGYCDEGPNKGLIYEFMANGNLAVHLKGTSKRVLTWEERLRIAIESGQGLEYLHNGSKQPIIHRDVKTTNILLSERFQAKLSDFGLSRMFTVEDTTHVTTVVAGTPGFLDPEYFVYSRLTEKSDVYSYGVVLLQIITGQAVVSETREKTHIKEWVESMLETGDIHSIIDPRIKGEYDTNSVWKAIEITMSCLPVTSISRPTMSQVLAELKECLAMERARIKMGCEKESKDAIEMIPESIHAKSNPLPR